MKLKNMVSLITLLCTLITIIIMIINKENIIISLITVIVVIILVYNFSLLVLKIMRKLLDKEEERIKAIRDKEESLAAKNSDDNTEVIFEFDEN